MTTGLAQSVHVRLVNHAKEYGVDPNLILTRYATERFLYRLSRSRHAERFVLKGALLLLVWLGETIRPTRDADLLGFGDLGPKEIRLIFVEICTVEVEPDGLTFDVDSIQVTDIRPEDAYGGQRVALLARLGSARLHVQVDVGIGDAVTPEPEWIDYPSLLALPRPHLRAYRPETAIAEKIHAMVELGTRNSRMRDFFDVHTLAMHLNFDGDQLTNALHATFERRGTEIPAGTPIALTPAFAQIDGKQAQWAAFVRRSRVAPESAQLTGVISSIATFAGPVLAAVGSGRGFAGAWPPGGPWKLGTEGRGGTRGND